MNALQHIALNCVNPRRQESFYSRHFGFKRARVFNPGTPGEFVMLRLGGVCIELFPSPASSPAPNPGEQPVGFKHLAFEVASLEETIRALKADGVETGEVIDCGPVVPGLRICFFKDPEGNSIEIMQGWSDDANPPAF